MKQLLNECIGYFKQTPGFKRTFNKIKEKYESLGYLGGNIVLLNLTDEEKDALSGLLKKPFNHKKATLKWKILLKR